MGVGSGDDQKQKWDECFLVGYRLELGVRGSFGFPIVEAGGGRRGFVMSDSLLLKQLSFLRGTLFHIKIKENQYL